MGSNLVLNAGFSSGWKGKIIQILPWWGNLVVCLVVIFVINSVTADEITLDLSDDTQVSVEVSSAKGHNLILWVPSEHGFPAGIDLVVSAMAKQGIESWRVDMMAAYFLPVQSSSLDKIPDKHISEVIHQAGANSGKNIYLLSSSRGAAVVLRGARRWQQDHPMSTVLRGAVLVHPNLYVETPEPGHAAEYLPITQASNLPLYVLQPALSPWRWQLSELRQRLEQGGSTVYMQFLPGIRDRFFFRPDATFREQQQHLQLARHIHRALGVLDHHSGPRTVAPLRLHSSRARLKQEVRLRQMDSQPALPLALQQFQGASVDLRQLRGQVVLVNFWASWCPPCVHEMPSMQILHNKFANKNFTILAVNMAESESEIDEFVNHKINIQFPVLLDKDGAALKQWKVFAFPTSYVIDKQGRFRYSLYGAIEWDKPEVVEIIKNLVME